MTEGSFMLKDGETCVLGEGDDFEFEEAHHLATERLFDVHFSTGREWESEETEDGGFTIRTTPDPNVVVYPNGVVALLIQPNMVVRVFELKSPTIEKINGFVLRLVGSIEESYDGIESATLKHTDPGYGGLAERVESLVSTFVDDE